MSRFPRGIDAQYLEHEHNERMRRVLALDVRYGNCGDEPVVEKPVVVQPEPEWSPYRDPFGFGAVRAFYDGIGVSS